jgi:hypothetical protein
MFNLNSIYDTVQINKIKTGRQVQFERNNYVNKK